MINKFRYKKPPPLGGGGGTLPQTKPKNRTQNDKKQCEKTNPSEKNSDDCSLKENDTKILDDTQLKVSLSGNFFLFWKSTSSSLFSCRVYGATISRKSGALSVVLVAKYCRESLNQSSVWKSFQLKGLWSSSKVIPLIHLLES